ncbi:5'/3'-nucleotidase SurE [Kwoniella shandongensis]|uniref:5'/3'-nucleotidase SurE n=1 Tax=Kwoniella shandongensis TaxID=1734106 RepID=A0A5M6BR80_9TREE|nr:5'/3'-nucleotidase SurE [Kwoniella shandongensis]KAA5524621.1 5'/3'-nucleotidase SurE [Kwoniella shandongensis]
MAPSPIYGDRPVVLLTNDDGPPSASSPNIFSFCKLLQTRLGWDVKVVIPDRQKSWVGKAYAISDVIAASYFYPLEPDGLNGEITTTARPLREGETMEWIMLSGTPATCTNIALHNLYPGEIDLVISGPNHGRNSSTAFALSSGTLGAALAGALSIPLPGPSTGLASLHEDHIPCIAVSYGVVTRPVTENVTILATEISVDICKKLFEDWGADEGPSSSTSSTTGKEKNKVQIYSVNVPLIEDALIESNRKVCWTGMWRNSYGQLFKTTKMSKSNYDPGDLSTQKQEQNKPQTASSSSSSHLSSKTSTAGPAALPTPDPSSPSLGSNNDSKQAQEQGEPLKFHFAPNMKPLLFPPIESLPIGSDAWAFAKGYVSVTPIRAEYAGLVDGTWGFGSEEGNGGKVGPGTIWE